MLEIKLLEMCYLPKYVLCTSIHANALADAHAGSSQLCSKGIDRVAAHMLPTAEKDALLALIPKTRQRSQGLGYGIKSGTSVHCFY